MKLSYTPGHCRAVPWHFTSRGIGRCSTWVVTNTVLHWHFGRRLELPFATSLSSSPAAKGTSQGPRERSSLGLLRKTQSSFLRITKVGRSGSRTPRGTQNTYLKTQPWAKVTGARQETQKGKGTPALPCPAQEQVRSLSLHLFFLKPWVPDLPSRGDTCWQSAGWGRCQEPAACPALALYGHLSTLP